MLKSMLYYLRPHTCGTSGHDAAAAARTHCTPDRGEGAVPLARVVQPFPAAPILTIQGVPNLSVSMPKLSPHGALASGIITVPPSANLFQ